MIIKGDTGFTRCQNLSHFHQKSLCPEMIIKGDTESDRCQNLPHLHQDFGSGRNISFI